MIVKRVQIETRQRLQSAYVFIHLDDSSIDSKQVDVSFNDGYLIVKHPQDDSHAETETFNLNSLRIKEGSLTSKQIFANCITLRLLTDQKTAYNNLSGGFKAEIMELTNKFKQSMNVTSSGSSSLHQIKNNIPYTILCKECKTSLCELTFDRVLPLPSSEQNDWFCHCTKDQQIDIAPKTTDLLYSECHYLLNPSQTNASIDQVGKYIRCKHCLTWLGSKHDEKSIKFYFNTTIFKSSESGVANYTTSALSDVFKVIKSISEDVHIIAPKIVLFCQVGETVVQYILLRIFDDNLQLQLHENSNVWDMVVAKVFFMFVSNRNEVVDAWCKDANAHSITISRPMFEECLSHLREKHGLMPAEFGTDSEGFSASYLMYDEE